MRSKQPTAEGPGLSRYLLFLLLCGAVGTVAALFLLALFALLIVRGGSFSALYKPAVFTAMLLCGALAGYMAARGLRKNGLTTGLFASVCCLLLLWLLSFLGESGREAAFLMPSLLCLIGGLAGGILGVNLKR